MDIEVQSIIDKLETDRANAEEEAEEGIALICTKLQDLGVSGARIEFDGAGDSGEIYGVDLIPKNLQTSDLCSAELKQEIEDWALTVLEGTGVDWYNNDGGFGTINIDVLNRKYSFDVYQRYTDFNLEASDTVEI